MSRSLVRYHNHISHCITDLSVVKYFEITLYGCEHLQKQEAQKHREQEETNKLFKYIQ